MKRVFPVILLFLIIGGVGLAFLLLNEDAGNIHVVELKEEGYTPNTLRIKKGDSVEFRTTLDKPYWPASNLHPSHGIFPEFDPKRELLPNESWTFKFGKSGQWGYHDHITPNYTGKIIVAP